MFNSIQICQEVAKKLMTPPNHLDESLHNGYAGIACFYEKMHEVFPEEGWRAIAFNYLKQAAEQVEKKGCQNLSLFHGLSGVCFAVNLCSNNGQLYSKLLQKSEEVLIKNLENLVFPEFIRHLDQDLDIPPSFYNLEEGLSGILAYLLLRKENPKIYETILFILSLFDLAFSRKRRFSGLELPGWTVAPQHQLAEDEKMKYPEGSFVLGTSFGITGCLSILSIAYLEGITTRDLKNTIRSIASWLREQKRETPHGISWPHTISWIEEDTSLQLNRDLWWSGIPAVSRSLYLAGKALQDKDLLHFAETTFLSTFSKPPAEWNAMGTSFAHGRAGMLALSYQMAQDIKAPSLWKQVGILEEDLKTFYRPASIYGFQIIDIEPSSVYRWVDNPNLGLGASGVALTLLSIQGRGHLLWDRAFAIR